MNISVIGLGKLGSVLAAVLADAGHNVIGADVDLNKVEAINAGQAPCDEPGLEELILQCGDRLKATSDSKAAVEATDITFVVTPTPSLADGRYSLNYVMQAMTEIAQALKAKESYHLVVLTSTVMPGDTGGKILPLLERLSGRTCGKHFGLCYNPEFIALGSVIQDMQFPDMVLIGDANPLFSDARSLALIYRGFLKIKPMFCLTNLVNAELAKISINTYLTMKISFANNLAEICERLPGADVDAVTAAVGADSRIGGKYLKGRVRAGGPCLPRDASAFSALAHGCDCRSYLAEAAETINHAQTQRLVRLIRSGLPDSADSVGILGLTYKPDTGVVEESQGLHLAHALASEGMLVTAYDPKGLPYTSKFSGLTVCASMQECLDSADCVVITTPWKEFKTLRPSDLKNDQVKVLDCWRILDEKIWFDYPGYQVLGRGPKE